MLEYEKYADGTRTLSLLETMIHREEAGASRFVGNTIVNDDGTLTNLVRFQPVESGRIPRPIRLKTNGEPPPEHSSTVWSGEMIVSSKRQSVTAYRPR